METKKAYRDLAVFLGRFFEGKVQKISINAGFSCPNRDGTKGWGGCTYCNNQTFSPDYCQREKSVTQQLTEGIRFFSRKYPTMRYLAYFQSYTNTYGETEQLIAKYEEALRVEGVVGLIVGTRPDCMPDALLDYFAELARKQFVMVEYGVESTLDRTLQRINRGHTYAEAEEAIRRTAAQGIHTGAHLILGLPGETREEILQHATRISSLPLETLKLHQLQLIRNTRMAKEYESNPGDFHLYDVDEYVELVVDFVERLRPQLVVERFVSQSPKELLIAPDWGLKNYEFVSKVDRQFAERQTWPVISRNARISTFGCFHTTTNIVQRTGKGTDSLYFQRRHGSRKPACVVDTPSFRTAIKIACHIGIATSRRIDHFPRTISGYKMKIRTIVNHRTVAAKRQ